MLEHIDMKIGSYKIKQTSFDTIKIVKSDLLFTLLFFVLFFTIGFLVIFQVINMPIWAGLAFIGSAFLVGFLAGVKERFVIDRGARVFTSCKISLFGTTALSKQERIDYESIKACVSKKKKIQKKQDGTKVITYAYTVSFVVDCKNYDFSSSNTSESEKKRCEEVCEVINNFL